MREGHVRGDRIANLPLVASGLHDLATGGLPMDSRFQSCIEACNACADACDECSTACLKEPDVHMMAACIRADLDCAAICRMASGFMARGSDFAVKLCAVCAVVCEHCASECGKHQAEHCRRCAKACRDCAAQCRQIYSTEAESHAEEARMNAKRPVV